MAHKPLILIVDDNVEWRRGIAEVLDAEGYETAQAIEGREALRKCIELKPDGVVLDLMMPGGSGWEVLRQLRERTQTRRTPVVLVSGFASELERVSKLPRVESLLKPVQVEDLLGALRQLGLGTRAVESDAAQQA